MITVIKVEKDNEIDKLELDELIPGLKDCFVKTNVNHLIKVSTRRYVLDFEWKKGKGLLYDIKISNRIPCLDTATYDEKDRIVSYTKSEYICEEYINHEIYNSLINFIKNNYDSAKVNNVKHLFTERKFSVKPITFFTVSNIKIMDMLINNKSNLQFIDKVIKKDESHYILDLKDDKCLKNILMMFTIVNDVYYYVDELVIKLNGEKLTFLCNTKNYNKVPNEKILESYLYIFMMMVNDNHITNNLGIKNIFLSRKRVKEILHENYNSDKFFNMLIENMDYFEKKLNEYDYIVVDTSIT